MGLLLRVQQSSEGREEGAGASFRSKRRTPLRNDKGVFVCFVGIFTKLLSMSVYYCNSTKPFCPVYVVI